MGVARGSLLPELLGEPDENSFGAPEVAEPIHVFMPDHFADASLYLYVVLGPGFGIPDTPGWLAQGVH
jgi:hypothetical protein